MNNYETNWGIDSLHQPLAETKLQPLNADRLISLSIRRPSQKTDWISALTPDYERSNHSRDDFMSSIINQDTTTYWISKLFAKLREFTDRFNCGLSTDFMMIECVPPDFHSIHIDDKSPGLTGVVFEGHISTPNNTLLIRGIGRCIQAFLVPSSVWLGISLNELHEDDYPPFMTLRATKDSLKTEVTVDGVERRLKIESSSIALLAKVLFSQLIKSESDTL